MSTDTKTPQINDLTRSGSQQLYQRLTRAISPVLILVFSAIIIVLTIAINLRMTLAVLTERQQSAALVRSILKVEINDVFDDIRNISQLNGMREFAVAVSTLPQPEDSVGDTEFIQARQSEILKLFEDLMITYDREVKSIAFLLPGGATWGSADRQNDIINLYPDLVTENTSSSMMDQTFVSALGASTGTLLVSPQVDSATTLTVYVPVNTIDQINVGVLAVQLDLPSIFLGLNASLLQSNFDFTQYRDFLIADQNNRILWNTGDELPDEAVMETFNRVTRGFEDWYIGTQLVSSYVINDYEGANFPWRLAISENILLSPTTRLPFTLIVIFGGLAFAFFTLKSLERMLRQTLRPIEQAARQVTDVASRLTMDEHQAQRELRRRTLLSKTVLEQERSQSQIVNVAESVERITQHLDMVREKVELENQRHRRDIEVAARIGRATATLYDLDHLFERAIELICNELNFYHAQIFIIDDVGRNAVLAYSRGETGSKMLAEHYRLLINSDSVIGTATKSKSPVTIQDSHDLKGQAFVYNPFLPDTRAEMALPLLLNNEVIGVLDIQSRFPYAFKQEDLPFFQLIADQLSIAIHNARLLNASQLQMGQVEALARRSARDAWTNINPSLLQERAYRYDLSNVEPVSVESIKRGQEDKADRLSVPIALRGEQIGELSAVADPGQQLSEGDAIIMRAVAERVALAIENARLFQETQISLSETSTLYQLSRFLNEADSLEDVLQSIIISVTSDADGAQIWLYDEAAPGQQPEWLTLTHKMSLGVEQGLMQRIEEGENAGETSLFEIGTRLFVTSHPLLESLEPGLVTLINNVEQDSRLDSTLLSMFRRIHTNAVVIIPLTVRTEQLGILLIHYPDTRDFNEQEGRVFAALIDQAGVAIDNRLLLRQTEEARRRSEILYIAGRQINTMQTFDDLIRAVMETRKDRALDFRLTLLEGELDVTGWPTIGRIVAQSRDGHVDETVRRHPLMISPDSLLRERKVVIYRDNLPGMDTIPPQVVALRREGYKMMAHFPLFSANQPIALLSVLSKTNDELSADDLDVYYALTGQMATQLENRRLLVRTENALDETRRLYLASRAISGAEDLHSVYGFALEHLTRPFVRVETDPNIVDIPDSDDTASTTVDDEIEDKTLLNTATLPRTTIAILLAQPEPGWNAQVLETVYTWSSHTDRPLAFDQVGDEIALADFPVTQMLLESVHSVYIRNWSQPPNYTGEAPVRQLLQAAGAVSLLITPLQYRQKWYGIVICQCDMADSFDEQYIRFVEAVADQVAIAIENRQLFQNAQIEAQRAQREAQRALALANATQLANQVGLEFEHNLGDVLASVAEAAGYDRWALHLFDAQAKVLNAFALHLPGQHLRTDETPIPSTVNDLNDVNGTNGTKRSDAAREPQRFKLSSDHPIVLALHTNQTLVVNDLGAYAPFKPHTAADQRRLTAYQTQYGKFVVTPIRGVSGGIAGTLMVGVTTEHDDLDDGDEEVVTTLASQIAVAQENRRLFLQVQSEQETLRSVMSTLPAGIVVLDPNTLQPVLANEQAELYLGEALRDHQTFTAENYHLYRTGTANYYPDEELPTVTAREGMTNFSDDIALIVDGAQLDLLVNAAPIIDARGQVSAIVTSFSDISNLRGLENTLQESLRETIAIYEAQQELSNAMVMDDVLDVLIGQLINAQASEAYVMLVEEEKGGLVIARSFTENIDDAWILVPLLNNEKPVAYTPTDLRELFDTETSLPSIFEDAYVVTVPLRTSARNLPIGWLIAIHYGEAFMFESQRLMSQLGGIASTVIDNRYLIQRTAQALQEAKTLYEANSAISSARDIHQLSDALHTALAPSAVHEYTAALATSSLDMEVIVHTEDEATQLLRAALLRQPLSEDGLFVEDVTALSDTAAFEGTLRAAVGNTLRAFGAVPLRVKGEPSGLILIAYHEPHYFHDSERRYLSAMSASASVVLDNIALVSEIRTALEETSMLYQANRQLIEASSPAQILQSLISYLIEDHIDHVFIALLKNTAWDSETAMIEIMANWYRDVGVDMEGMLLPRSHFPLWRILSTPEFLHVADVDTVADDVFDEIDRGGLEILEARSFVVVPLRVSNRVIGAIWMSSRQARQISARAERVYRTFGEQASLSLEASYLLQQTERRATQLQTSAEISSSAGRILNLEVLLPQVVDLIKDSFSYDHVQIFLLDEPRENAVLRASTGEAGQELLRRNHKLKVGSTSVVGRTTSDGVPIIAQDTTATNVIHMPNPFLPLTRSEMALPLMIKDQVIGALDVQSNQANFFTEEDIAALKTLAAQISIAIENARLYADAQTQADRMGFLFEATRSAAASESLEATLENVASYLHNNQSVLATVLYLQRDYLDSDDQPFSVLEAVALKGIDQPLSEIEAPRLDQKKSLLIRSASSLEARIVDNIAKESSYIPVASGAQSAIVVPLISSGELLGIVVQESDQLNRFNYDDLQLMSTLSSSISAVLQSTQLLERLQDANEELRELDRIKSEFLANMSHELRTPLNSIIGFSRVMLKGIDGALTEMQEQDLNTIYTSGQHLLTLINDVLDQAKIAAGKMDLKSEHFEMKTVIESVKSIGVGLVKEKGLQLLVEMAQTMPKAFGDEFRTRQVLINLVSNASKFTNQGSITIRAYPIEDKAGKTRIRVDVIDTGIGIAKKDIPLLFEAFRQVDSSLTRTAGGTGLGLPIARSLVQMQGGEMTVVSEVNVGSTFSITLPTEPPAVEEETDTQDAAPAALKRVERPIRRATGTLKLPPNGNDSSQEGMNKPVMEMQPIPMPRANGPSKRQMQAKRQVLLIEDQPEMVDQMRRALQPDGFEVLAASITLEAEAMASGLHPTLIVMDVNFQNGAGWEILERLKSRDDTADIPIIVVTLSNDEERARAMQVHSFIQRPFLPETLLEAALMAEALSNQPRILIIDDQPDAVRMLEQILMDNGQYRVFHATNGADGIAMVARRRPDLILLDLRMPEVDGFKVLEELRSHPEAATIPVLVVTGDPNLSAAEQSLLGNLHVLPKTSVSEADFIEFIERVQKHLSGEEGLG
jgi:GAF domain-containing protein/CheY-like chemotaxis protein